MNFLTEFGDLAVLLPIAAVVLVWLLRSPESYRPAAAWAIALLLCIGTLGVLKTYFSACPTSLVKSPSGHAGLSMLVYGGLATCAAARFPRVAMPALIGGIGLALAIGLTRVALGAHDTAEIAIGFGVGGTALAIFAAGLLRQVPSVRIGPLILTAAILAGLLHGQDVHAEQLFQLLGPYLHAEGLVSCL